MKTVMYKTNEELWKIEKSLKEQGYRKIADCYWAQIFSDGKNEITLERE